MVTVFFGVVTPFYGWPAGLKGVMWLAAIFTIGSGLQYIVQGMRFLNAVHDEPRTPDETTLYR